MAKRGGKISPATEFKPGVSGNPLGKPKGTISTKTILKRFLEISQQKTNQLTGEKENLTIAEQMALTLIGKALKGDIKAFQEVYDRYEGKAKQFIDHTTNGKEIDNGIKTIIIEDAKSVTDRSQSDI